MSYDPILSLKSKAIRNFGKKMLVLRYPSHLNAQVLIDLDHMDILVLYWGMAWNLMD